jgi:hypothetical protein
MNRPNDDIERSLRRYFEDFDAHYDDDAPSPAAWENIKTQIEPAPAQRWWRHGWVLPLLLLIGVGGGNYLLFDQIASVNQSNRSVAPLGSVGKNTHITDSNKIYTERLSIRGTTDTDSPRLNPQASAVPRGTFNTTRGTTDTDSPRMSPQASAVPRGTFNTTRGTTDTDLLRLSPQASVVPRVSFNTTRGTTDTDLLRVSPQESVVPQVSHIEPQRNAEELPNVQTLSPTDLQNLPTAAATPHIMQPASKMVEKRKSFDSRAAWTLSVQPFQTFQYLTNHISTSDFQLAALHIPPAWSQARTGVQVQAGVERALTKRLSWRLSGVYRAMPQFVNYQISTSEFLVKETGPNQVSIERVTIDISEQKTRQWLGLQAGYAYHFNRGFFVSAAAEGSIDWANSHATQLGLTASAGWARYLGGRYSLVVEPTYTYFFQKTTDTRQVLQIQPYTLGMKLGLRITR